MDDYPFSSHNCILPSPNCLRQAGVLPANKGDLNGDKVNQRSIE